MKQFTMKQCVALVRICMLLTLAAIFSLFLFSFTVADKYADEFLKQLGISKTDADSKITNSLLWGSLDAYGLRGANKIVLANRTAVTRDLLSYVKKQASSPAFIKEYATMRDGKKPKLMTTQTPEAFHQEAVTQQRKAVTDMEALVKNSDASMKPTYEKILEESKKRLKETEDPNNKTIQRYRQNYQSNVKFADDLNKRSLAEWEAKYPTNHLLFVKQRLQQFLAESADIDFGAETFEKNGKKYFVNKAYESKGNRWKMGFRAGKEVVEPARAFAEQWIAEIK